eukprot:2166007-Rhodomonas_salina.2
MVRRYGQEFLGIPNHAIIRRGPGRSDSWAFAGGCKEYPAGTRGTRYWGPPGPRVPGNKPTSTTTSHTPA